ncbi:MAG: hypothetical protein IT581_11630 [Verrucomicrobiales bacterium]|nr:hypothetical protein [Verrucomicrobiales bacterium]
MNTMSKGLVASLVRGVCIALTLIVTASSPSVSAAGGKTGGGSTKTVEARVTGYVTAIDYTARTITIGASYYGSGNLKVDSNTKISLNNVNCAFEDLALGTWVEARYDFTTRIATKLSATGSSSS